MRALRRYTNALKEMAQIDEYLHIGHVFVLRPVRCIRLAIDRHAQVAVVVLGHTPNRFEQRTYLTPLDVVRKGMLEELLECAGMLAPKMLYCHALVSCFTGWSVDSRQGSEIARGILARSPRSGPSVLRNVLP
jgi:hypothetical protein